MMVAEVVRELESIGLGVGTGKTHWTSFPPMVEQAGSALPAGSVGGHADFRGIDGGSRRSCRSVQANTCFAPSTVRLAFLWSSSKIASWRARVVWVIAGTKRPTTLEGGQRW